MSANPLDAHRDDSAQGDQQQDEANRPELPQHLGDQAVSVRKTVAVQGLAHPMGGPGHESGLKDEPRPDGPIAGSH